MKRYTVFAALGASACLVLSTAAHAAVVVHTAPFIASPIAANDLEAASQNFWAPGTPYSQGGITLEYTSARPDQQAVDLANGGVAGFGNFSWFQIDNQGYTSVTLTDGSSFNELQFAAASDFNTSALVYVLRYQGNTVATGVAGNVNPWGAPTPDHGYLTYGLSGITFDEVWLQNPLSGTTFNPTGNDGLALDNILIGREAGGVPEPATWALLVGGFGLAGCALRRRGTLHA